MKKVFISWMAVLIAGLLSVGCADLLVSEEPVREENPGLSDLVTFKATLENNLTKTGLASDMKVVWTSGDKIKIFNSANPAGAEFTLVTGAGEATGTFSGTLTGDGPFYAVYPYSSGAKLSGSSIVTTLPQKQTYAENSFGTGANLAVAKGTTKDNLSFRNLCGVLSVTLTGSVKVKAVNIYPRGSELLNGKVTVSGLDSEPTVAIAANRTDDTNHSLSLSCSNVALTSSGTTFNLVVPVGALADGFTLEVIDASGKAMLKTAKGGGANTIERSMVRPMPAFDYVAQYQASFLQVAGDFGASTGVSASGTFANCCTYTNGQSQYALQPSSIDVRKVRFQDWTAGYAMTLTRPKTLSLGEEGVSLTVNEVLGATGTITAQAYSSLKVIKRTATRAWLTDENYGFVVLMED